MDATNDQIKRALVTMPIEHALLDNQLFVIMTEIVWVGIIPLLVHSKIRQIPINIKDPFASAQREIFCQVPSFQVEFFPEQKFEFFQNLFHNPYFV